MPRLSLCDYIDAYILAKEIITIPNTETVAVPSNTEKSNI